MVYIITSRTKSKARTFYDSPNADAIIKIGKEINRAKDLGSGHIVEKEFGREANALLTPKSDMREEAKQVVKEALDRARSEK